MFHNFGHEKIYFIIKKLWRNRTKDLSLLVQTLYHWATEPDIEHSTTGLLSQISNHSLSKKV